MIKLTAIGNLGKDCTTNTVNGRNVINFNVAHTEKYKDAQNNMVEKTTWVECAYWTDRTAVAQYLTKGTQVYVEGTPEVRTYTKNDGTQGASLTLRVLSVQLLGSRSGGSGDNSAPGYGNSSQNSGYASGSGYGNSSRQPAPAVNTVGADSTDDLPF